VKCSPKAYLAWAVRRGSGPTWAVTVGWSGTNTADWQDIDWSPEPCVQNAKWLSFGLQISENCVCTEYIAGHYYKVKGKITSKDLSLITILQLPLFFVETKII